MNYVEHVCVFVRATGARLLAAERLVCSLPLLLGPALAECDLVYRTSSSYLVVTLRFIPGAFAEPLRARLGFWAARAGGRALSVDGMADRERDAFRLHLQSCELQRTAIQPDQLFEAAGSLFAEAGAPAARRRSAGDRPMLVVDAGGPAWEGASYQPFLRELFLPSPLAPPIGDEVMLVVRAAGVDKPVGVRTRVTGRRAPAEAGPGKLAGFSLAIPEAAPSIRALLERHAATAAPGARVAPRYAVRAPVTVAVGGAAGAPRPPAPGATIEYATVHELQAAFVENLSHGGAFVRSSSPMPVGTPLSLQFRLPNGAELDAQAVVAFVNRDGMGVRFSLDAEGEAALQAAVAHLSVRSRRAVVMDDDATFRQQVADALGERGFEASTAPRGAEGLRLVQDELLGLDLLLTDVAMPGRGGEIFVRTIRSAGGELGPAIVVVTGKMDLELERTFEAAGADAVLDKALGPELVAQAADAALERRRAGRAPA
jgi:CheY-like chemotaxis protein/Tfp pilus assembly protein PilZ